MVKAYGGEGENRPPTTTGLRKTGPRTTGLRTTDAAHPDSHEPAATTNWVVVIPVKGTPNAKSRFGPGDHTALALAIALDTVEAALATPSVSDVLVVTSPAASAIFDATEALVLIEDGPHGLTEAIAQGVETAAAMSEPGSGVAVLLGDLPALAPAELAEALDLARATTFAMVADSAGTGTTLITAADGRAHRPLFGEGSAEAHRAAGYLPLDIPADSGLRTDVDSLEELTALDGRLGPHTAAER